MERHGGHLKLSICDEGTSFDPHMEPGTGLDGMRESALLIRARLTIEPTEPHGTEVRLELPLPPNESTNDPRRHRR